MSTFLIQTKFGLRRERTSYITSRGPVFLRLSIYTPNTFVTTDAWTQTLSVVVGFFCVPTSMLIIAAEKTTLLVLNDLWREHQTSYAETLSLIRMPDGRGIFDKRDQSRQDNADALHSRVEEVLRSPVSFGKYTVQFARDYDVARRRGELYRPIEPTNWRTHANISSIENKAIMFKWIDTSPFDSVKTIFSNRFSEVVETTAVHK